MVLKSKGNGPKLEKELNSSSIYILLSSILGMVVPAIEVYEKRKINTSSLTATI